MQERASAGSPCRARLSGETAGSSLARHFGAEAKVVRAQRRQTVLSETKTQRTTVRSSEGQSSEAQTGTVMLAETDDETRRQLIQSLTLHCAKPSKRYR